MSMIQIVAIAGVVVLVLLLIKMRQDRQKAGRSERPEGRTRRRGRGKRAQMAPAQEPMPLAAASAETAAAAHAPPAPIGTVPAYESPESEPPPSGWTGEHEAGAASQYRPEPGSAPLAPEHDPFAQAPARGDGGSEEVITEPGWPLPGDLDIPFADGAPQAGQATPTPGSAVPVAGAPEPHAPMPTFDGGLARPMAEPAGSAGEAAPIGDWPPPVDVPPLAGGSGPDQPVPAFQASSAPAPAVEPAQEAPAFQVPAASDPQPAQEQWVQAFTPPEPAQEASAFQMPAASDPQPAQDQWVQAFAPPEPAQEASAFEGGAPGPAVGPVDARWAQAAPPEAVPALDLAGIREPGSSAPGGNRAAIGAVNGSHVADEPAEERTGRFALGGFAQSPAHEAVAAVSFRSPLPAEPTAWALAPAPDAAPGTLVLSVDGALNCDAAAVSVLMDPGFAPSQEGFTVKAGAAGPGPFVVSGTFRVA